MATTTSLLLLSLLLFLIGCHHVKPPTRSKSTSSYDLATCLSAAGIHNFTLYNTPLYYTALNLSIQNLRFLGPAIQKPEAIIFPSSQLQLQNTILCLRGVSLSIRLRSGGHSYEGSCPTVGSGGHIAGGGFGLLSRKYGLAADNVIDAVLIDESGRALNRTEMSEDLFWAIRGGGGGNWGAVYSWHVRLLPVPHRVSAIVVNRPSSVQLVAELVITWQSVSPYLPDEFYLSAFVGASLPECDGTISVTFKGLYLGPKQEAIRILQRQFPDIGLSHLIVQEMSWIESVVLFSGLPRGSSVSDLKDRVLHSKNFFKAKSDYVQVPVSQEGLIGAINLLSQEPKAHVILDPYGGAMSRIRPGDLPFPHRKGNLYTIQYMIEWTAEDDWKREYYMNWIRFLYDYMEDHVSKNPRVAYINYLDLDLGTNSPTNEIMHGENPTDRARAWGERYFLGNYDRLVRIKTAVDPYDVFSYAQSVPPLVFRLRSETEIEGISEARK